MNGCTFLTDRFKRDINKEILKHKHKLPVKTSIKVNNLEDPYFINLLYKAVAAVVIVELILRSIYCLIAEQEIISEHIIIKRLMERYFEPTGLFNFWADCYGKSKSFFTFFLCLLTGMFVITNKWCLVIDNCRHS